MSKAVWIRLGASLGAICIYSVINILLYPVATTLSGESAAGQFTNRDAAGIESSYLMSLFGHFSVPGLLLLLVLLVIWGKPAQRLLSKIWPAVLVLMAGAFLSTNAHAYYDKNDYAEAVMILPNESAFFIPDVGANKDTQAKFGSAEYLEANKVAAKRFVIPHAKFAGSGLWADFYVPTGRLIIVDRTPYNREWTAAHDRGTSTKDQSFPCQSAEGLNIRVEIGVAASVLEENAAKFLYWFGTTPPAGDRRDPQVVFTSVYSGRSLADVMDSVGRGKVQSLVCRQIGMRNFDKANADINVIMDAVEKDTTAFLAARGITLDYIGWAGTWTFDDAVQKAVNDRYVASSLAPSVPTLEALADIKVKEGLGDGLRSKGLPSSLVAIPERLLGSLSAMFGGSPTTASK